MTILFIEFCVLVSSKFEHICSQVFNECRILFHVGGDKIYLATLSTLNTNFHLPPFFTIKLFCVLDYLWAEYYMCSKFKFWLQIMLIFLRVKKGKKNLSFLIFIFRMFSKVCENHCLSNIQIRFLFHHSPISM